MSGHLKGINPGDIIIGLNNRNIKGRSHYIIYLGIAANQEDLFLGAMLTHSEYGGENIELEESHFISNDEHGERFEVSYDHSFISSDLYHKKKSWAPFFKVGQLSEEGLQFVLENLDDKIPGFFRFNQL